MSTRFRLGKGFTIGRSGPRYGRSIPGIDKSYVSVGKSGTLLAGYGVRHWSAGKRGAAVPASGSDSAASVLVTLAVFVAVLWAMFAFIGAAERDYCKTAPAYATERAPACGGTP